MSALTRSVSLQGLTKALSLGPLAFEDPVVEVFGGGRAGRFGHEMMHHVPSVKSRLQPVHSTALPKLKGFIRERVDARLFEGVFGRQALQSVFARKSPAVAAVVTEVFQPKPHIPGVLVAALAVQGGGRRQVKSVGFSGHDLGQHVVEEAVVGLGKASAVRAVQVVHVLPAPRFPGALHFVVSAPQSQGGVMCQPAHLFFCFLTHVLGEVLVVWHHGAGKHEVLPDQQS